MIFISLELLSLSLYILAAFNKRSLQSWEAALKYFLFGGMSAAFLLFGFSLLYGLSGSTNLLAHRRRHRTARLSTRSWLIAMVMTAIGFGFKVAAAPFHFWAPDVYQGAPAPSAAFIASGFQSRQLLHLLPTGSTRICRRGRQRRAGPTSCAAGSPCSPWWPLLSMVLGNLVAIVQSSVRRLLAYSAIAHAGYMLLAIVAHTQQSLAALMYYVITYALATIGAFAVIAVVEEQRASDRSPISTGSARQAPVLSLCLLMFLLSLAGIPPLAGFFGKFYLFVDRAASIAEPALAGHSGHRHERRVALLLPESPQAHVRCASPSRRGEI